MEYTVHKGTQRSWDREVGVGQAPEWYLTESKFDLDINTVVIDDTIFLPNQSETS